MFGGPAIVRTTATVGENVLPLEEFQEQVWTERLPLVSATTSPSSVSPAGRALLGRRKLTRIQRWRAKVAANQKKVAESKQKIAALTLKKTAAKAKRVASRLNQELAIDGINTKNPAGRALLGSRKPTRIQRWRA